jgi:hypothetical protein
VLKKKKKNRYGGASGRQNSSEIVETTTAVETMFVRGVCKATMNTNEIVRGKAPDVASWRASERVPSNHVHTVSLAFLQTYIHTPRSLCIQIDPSP